MSVAKELFAFQLDERDMNTDALFYSSKVNDDSDLSPLSRTGRNTKLEEVNKINLLVIDFFDFSSRKANVFCNGD